MVRCTNNKAGMACGCDFFSLVGDSTITQYAVRVRFTISKSIATPTDLCVVVVVSVCFIVSSLGVAAAI